MLIGEGWRGSSHLVIVFEKGGQDLKVCEIDVHILNVERVLLHARAVSLEINRVIILTLFCDLKVLHDELAHDAEGKHLTNREAAHIIFHLQDDRLRELLFVRNDLVDFLNIRETSEYLQERFWQHSTDYVEDRINLIFFISIEHRFHLVEADRE